MHAAPDHTHIDDLHDDRISRIVEEALAEDIGVGDLTTDAIVDPEARGSATLVAKETGILAGMGVAALVFRLVDEEIVLDARHRDGDRVAPGLLVATIHGTLAGILKAERTALNLLQRMSGIATLTRAFVDAIEGTSAKITDTRKTAPGLRILDKRAVVIGGGVNHRFGLDDMVLIKENHIAAAGGIRAAVEACRIALAKRSYRVKVEVETRTLDDVREVLALKGVDRILLDNFSLEETREAVALINHAVEVEASGNVSLATVRAIAETGVDVISVGALTHSPRALDLSLLITGGAS